VYCGELKLELGPSAYVGEESDSPAPGTVLALGPEVRYGLDADADGAKELERERVRGLNDGAWPWP
jgi:hypothetical protein